jgi:hypothetical protein
MFRWKFAYEAIVNECVRPRLASFKWETIKENIARYKEYHEIYFQQLNHHFTKQHKKRIQVEFVHLFIYLFIFIIV